MFDTFDMTAEEAGPLGSPPEIEPHDLVFEADVVIVNITRNEARLTSIVKDIVETKAFQRDGYSSATALLKHRYAMHQGAAQQLVRRANGLADAQLVSLAYERGAISTAQVDALLEASYLAPEPFAKDEGSLVELAMDTPQVRELRKSLDYWAKEVAAEDQAADRDLARELRGVRARRVDGMVHASVWFDADEGEQFLAAIEPGPPAEDDHRSIYQRRSDQLIGIINGATDRPNITVHVSAEQLSDPPRAISESSFGTYMSAFEVERLACDACIARVVFGPKGQPIDVGRSKRLVTKGMRTALEARDLGCVFPGCDRPAHWCDAHHIIHWSKGGRTCLSNLVLLCRHHHTLMHEAGWTIRGGQDSLEFYRPDGSRLGDQPSRGPLIPPEPPPRVDIRNAFNPVAQTAKPLVLGSRPETPNHNRSRHRHSCRNQRYWGSDRSRDCQIPFQR
jgi:hypothetical protein